MTREEIKMIQKSWLRVIDKMDEAGLLFYRRLFDVEPKVRPLFKIDIEKQGRKLMDVLNWIVLNLQDIDAALDAARELARRHVKYGVKAEHYPVVGHTLIWTLRKMIGSEWTKQLEQLWTQAYEALAQVMIEEHKKIQSFEYLIRYLEQELSEVINSVIAAFPEIVGIAISTTQGATVSRCSSESYSNIIGSVVSSTLGHAQRLCEAAAAGRLEEIKITGSMLHLYIRQAGSDAAIGVLYPSQTAEGIISLLIRSAALKIQSLLSSFRLKEVNPG
ncbi:globin domain-containing protein [Candidatus Methylacidiphilum infernorum]|uniref:Hemoglobin-like flavoprotein fused to Roadblock/LC7 domain n=1 Tax=Methylacidiphilum infernorum (isolate V4) TaxID=481448 RepID=B3DUZ1_METI4|nr:globin domain-containing protein [Candidatus Methylacidiphilum infernorum]ACD83144.1 Hemoglobin-like flavoprotein fused to Roadblock/LC7 domain [Methylacidiphilum infernorum V4]